MTRARDLADLLTGGQTITTADNTTQLTLSSTDADANVGPVLDLVRDSGSPADSDLLGSIKFIADDDGGNATTFASVSTQIGDASDGTESCALQIKAMSAGSLVSRADFLVSETVFNNGSIDLDFRVESDSDANAFFIQGDTGDIGISTNSPSTHSAGAGIPTVVLQGNSSSHADRSGGLVFVSQDGGSTAKTWLYMDTDMFIQTATNSDMRFYTGNTERMKILSGGNVDFSASHILLDNGYGINFAATSDAGGMTSEILDDYEEGTWTASVVGSGGGTAQTMSGYYTKVGNKVYVHASAVSGLNLSSSSGVLVINGLPFTAKSGAYQAFQLIHNNAGTYPSGRTQVEGYVSGNTQIVAITSGSGVGWNDFNIGSNTSAGIIVSGTYEVA